MQHACAAVFDRWLSFTLWGRLWGQVDSAARTSSARRDCRTSVPSLVMPLMLQTSQHACSTLQTCWMAHIARPVQGIEPVTTAAVPIACACLMQWGLAFGRAWEHLEGETSGQTQTATGRSTVWAHPVDAHFLCKVCSATVPDQGTPCRCCLSSSAMVSCTFQPGLGLMAAAVCPACFDGPGVTAGSLWLAKAALPGLEAE